MHHLGRLVVIGLAAGIGVGLAGGHGRVDRGDVDVEGRVALSDSRPHLGDVALLCAGECPAGAGVLERRRVARRP